MKSLQMLRAARESTMRSVNVFMRDVGNGLLEVSHNSLALLGLAVVVTLVFVAGRPDLRQQTETWALGWLQERHESRTAESEDLTVAAAEPDAVERATAVNPKELTQQQAAVAKWISRRYNVALEPIGRLVQEAWAIGQHAGLDPTLILAIAAIESRFNPFAQSAMGAQGLMQVMTRVHVRQVRALRRHPCRLRPDQQPEGRRAGAARVHRARRRPGSRPALVRGRRQPERRRRLHGQGAGRAGAHEAGGQRQRGAGERAERRAQAVQLAGSCGRVCRWRRQAAPSAEAAAEQVALLR